MKFSKILIFAEPVPEFVSLIDDENPQALARSHSLKLLISAAHAEFWQACSSDRIFTRSSAMFRITSIIVFVEPSPVAHLLSFCSRLFF